MAECGITGKGEVAPMLRLLGGHAFADYYLNLELFDPKFDRDFRNEKVFSLNFGRFFIFKFIKEEDTVKYRGGRVYHQPYGSICYAIKVKF